jgi:ABC-type antimicrobial peptide transport system permease subunit
VARGLGSIGVVRDQIATIGYSTSAPENLIASVQRYLHVVEIVLSGIGAIALAIASLGIANALFAAVRERRREIGVLKAIGARDRDVLRIFLIEAASLGFLGGTLGAATGWAMARALTSVVNGYLSSEGLPGVELGLQLPVLVGGVGCSVILALVAGALPALRAARLPAREAMVDL